MQGALAPEHKNTPGFQPKTQHRQNMEDVLIVGTWGQKVEVWTPSEQCQGALEQGTEIHHYTQGPAMNWHNTQEWA